MNLVLPSRTRTVHPRSIVVDVEQEMSYWSEQLPDLACYRPHLLLEHYMSTLRFAYDSYLLHPHARIEELLPWLRTKYLGLPSSRRLDWQDAEPVVRAVWQRLLNPGRANA
jgi:hypothetical protein